jgi:hypothetical protein
MSAQWHTDAVSAVAIAAITVVWFSRDAWRLTYGSEFRLIPAGQWRQVERAARVAHRLQRDSVNKTRVEQAERHATAVFTRVLPRGHVIAWRDLEGAHFSGVCTGASTGARHGMLTIKSGMYHVVTSVSMMVFIARVSNGSVWISRKTLPSRVQRRWTCAAARKRPAGFVPIEGCGKRFRTIGAQGTVLNTIHPFLAIVGVGLMGHPVVGAVIALGIWVYMDYSLRAPCSAFLFARQRPECRARWIRFAKWRRGRQGTPRMRIAQGR